MAEDSAAAAPTAVVHMGAPMKAASSRTLVVANILAYALNTIVTFVSVTGVFGETNGYVSAKFQTIITPAGWAFSIWGIIFTAELAFVVAQASGTARESDLVQKGVGWSWVSACAFQCAWTLAFAQEQLILSTVFIFGIFLSLATIVIRSAPIPPLKNRALDLLCRIPLTIHFAWLAAASALNVNLVVVQKGAPASTQLATGLVSLSLLLILSTQAASKNFAGRCITALVSAWALTAIGFQLASPMDRDTCEAATGSPDTCNLISEIFDTQTTDGVQKTAYTLAAIAAATVALTLVSDVTHHLSRVRSELSTAADEAAAAAGKVPLI